MYAKLNTQQINLLKLGRNLDEPTRAQIRNEVFALAKQTFGIPSDHKLRVEIDNAAHPDYAVLIRKKDGSKYPVAVLGQAPSSQTHQPPQLRWFDVSIVSLVADNYIDALDWDDGFTDFETDPQIVVIDGYTCAISDGQLYVQLREDQL